MSDNDLIRRGDALALPYMLSPSLDADDGYFVSVDAIKAIPAAQPTVKPLRYIEPEGETLDQMRDHARQHPLAQAGDMRLVWVNEGDLHMHTIFHAVQPTVSPDVAALVEAVRALRDAMRDNIVKNDEPHTVVLPDGSCHSGPVVDFLHALVSAQISVLDATLARVKGVV